jgi:phosphoribosylaminoimidazole-succinocarboxamide synthase
MQKLEKIYEGKAKCLFNTENKDVLIQYFKDDATAFNNVKKAVISGKGVINNFLSEYLFNQISTHLIPTHFISRLSEREQLIKKVTIIPVEVIIRNIVAGSMAKRLGLEEGLELASPVFEICYKKDELGDPLINSDHAIKVLQILSLKEFEEIKFYALKINQILLKIFFEIGIKLVDFKIEFGRNSSGKIVLADEISPDSCRLWDKETLRKLDKDIFRRDLGSLTNGYLEVASRLKIAIPNLDS